MTHKLYHEKTCIVKYNVRYILSLFSFLLYESNRKKNRKNWEEDESQMGKEKRKKKNLKIQIQKTYLIFSKYIQNQSLLSTFKKKYIVLALAL